MANNAQYMMVPPAFLTADKSDWFNIVSEPLNQVKTKTWLQNLSEYHFNQSLTSSDYSTATSFSSSQNGGQTHELFGYNNVQVRSSFPGCKGQTFSSVFTSNISDTRTRSYPVDDRICFHSSEKHEDESCRARKKMEVEHTGTSVKKSRKKDVSKCLENTQFDTAKQDFTISSTMQASSGINSNNLKCSNSSHHQLQNIEVTATEKKQESIKESKSYFQNSAFILGDHEENDYQITSDDLRINKILEEKLNSNNKISSSRTIFRSFSDSPVHRRAKNFSENKIKRRKSVHFADTSGYELEIHIPFSQADDYNVPPRLMEALHKIRSNEKNKILKDNHCSFLRHYSLVLKFQQPFLEATFQRRITQQKVCLESISIAPHSLTFTGIIRVVNLEFEKQVTVRCSCDRWKTFVDIPAQYVTSLKEFEQDQFSFRVEAPETALNTKRIEVAIHYSLPRSKRDFWDNNCRLNYVIDCMEYPCDDGMMT